MSRTIMAFATAIVVVVIGVTIWVSTRSHDNPPAADQRSVAPQFDTTGGQEMRPRWSNGGQADDATGT